MELHSYAKYLVKWIRTQVHKAGAKGVVVGLSGGIDSAVVAILCQQSFPDKHLVLTLPCESNPQAMMRADKLIANFGLCQTKVDLTPSYRTLLRSLEPPSSSKLNATSQLARANLKARLRMSALYYHANQRSYLVVGTDNWAEWYTGYFTKYGDGGVDLLPIIHLLKRDVSQLAVLLGVPKTIIQATPSADLWTGQTDEQELGVTYQQIDRFLIGQSQPPLIKQKIMDHYQRTIHKRRGCLMPELRFRSLAPT